MNHGFFYGFPVRSGLVGPKPLCFARSAPLPKVYDGKELENNKPQFLRSIRLFALSWMLSNSYTPFPVLSNLSQLPGALSVGKCGERSQFSLAAPHWAPRGTLGVRDCWNDTVCLPRPYSVWGAC